MKKVIVLLICCFELTNDSLAEKFFYDLEDNSKSERNDCQQNKNTIKKKVNNKKTIKTYGMYDNSLYEAKPFRPEKKKENKPVEKKVNINEDIKHLLRENSRLVRENTKLANELKRSVEVNTKAIEDLNKRLDEYEKI